MRKTNSMRLLESASAPYQVFEFSTDIRSALEVADAVGVPAERVFKTLVVVREGRRPLLAVLSGSKELDLKKLAKAAGEKRLRMAGHDEAERLTGLQVGGISGLALTHKGFDVFVDSGCLAHEQILVSAGCRGINLGLAPQDLIRVLKAQVADIAA